MKQITVKVGSDNKSDNSSTSIIHERKQGSTWARIAGKDIVTNKDDPASFILRQGDRLVVEAYPEGAVVYDHAQGTARREEPVQNPSAKQANDGSDASKPVGQATPRPTSSAPDRGPEGTQSHATTGQATTTTGPASHPGASATLGVAASSANPKK